MRPELLTREENYYNCPFCLKAPIALPEHDFIVHFDVHIKDKSTMDVVREIVKEHFYAYTKKY